MKAESRKKWARSNATNILRVAIALLFLGLAVWAITLNRYDLVIAGREPWLWLTVALVSVGPELAGIVIGVVTIDYLNERRQREQLKEQLIRQMGSNIRDVAVPAVRELTHHGWLQDGSLRGLDFEGANLSEGDLGLADLRRANLRKVNLSSANLTRANLSGASLMDANLSKAFLMSTRLDKASMLFTNLRGANLWLSQLNETSLGRANLSGAGLELTNLSGADLHEADMSGAHFGATDLSGANLEGTNLSGAEFWRANLSGTKRWTIEQLEQAEIGEGTIMPDNLQLQAKGVRPIKFEHTGPKRVEGPTFKQWKTQYLAKHGGTERDTRGIDSELDTLANSQSDNGSPDPI